jgi:hypothetical protein
MSLSGQERNSGLTLFTSQALPTAWLMLLELGAIQVAAAHQLQQKIAVMTPMRHMKDPFHRVRLASLYFP